MLSLLEPYTPTEEMPWDLRRVAHLHRRGGFAATWSEVQRDLKDGPKASIDRLLSGKARGRIVPEHFGGEIYCRNGVGRQLLEGNNTFWTWSRSHE